jgi:hypothetical protein
MEFYRTKVQKISKPVTSFGGIYFVNQEFTPHCSFSLPNQEFLLKIQLIS